MKNQLSLLPSLLCAALVVASGCGQTDEPAAGAAPDAARPAGGALEKAVATAQAQTEVVKQKAQEAVTNAQKQINAATSQAQSGVDQARKLLGENKWSEALALLNQLSGQPLSPDQQSAVQGLKDQAQKGAETAAKSKATDEAAKAVGGLLPK